MSLLVWIIANPETSDCIHTCNVIATYIPLMKNLDWQAILISDFSWAHALEIVVRTLLMFTMVIVILRMSGKKGVRQLSLFEVAIIIALGSAAGDPMFDREVSIAPSLVVFAVILIFYRTLTYFASKNEKVEAVLEGDPMYIIENGEFVLQDRTAHNFATDEFFAEMRLQNIEHLGQVRVAILETNGQMSFFYYDDDEVQPGLPILPRVYGKRSREINTDGLFACTYCGKTAELSRPSACKRCHKEEWVLAIDKLRIT